MTAYVVIARLTVLCYFAMAVAAWRAGLHKSAATAALFAVANFVIFCTKGS